MYAKNVIVLCPQEVITLDVGPVDNVRDAWGHEPLGFWAEDAVEEMVVCLASVEAAWAAGEFTRLSIGVQKVIGLAERTGLPDVASVARSLSEVLKGDDATAIAAVTARLVRVGEHSLATLLEIGYRHV